MDNGRSKKRLVYKLTSLLVLCLGIITFLLLQHDRAVPGRLLDGTELVLEKICYGTNHLRPKAPFEDWIRRLPPNWLRTIKWNPGSQLRCASEHSVFSFWLGFSRPPSVQTIGYALADANGFEAPMLFDGPFAPYEKAGFGTRQFGLVRGSSNFPVRARKFLLRLYQLNVKGERVRVAEFPITNAGFKDSPVWKPDAIPSQRQTNGLVFILCKAEVGISPPGKPSPPYELQAGAWSEFRFRVEEQRRPSALWTIKECWLSAPANPKVRVSSEDLGAFNGQFSRLEGDEIVCFHRWPFWSDEPAWKLEVHFEHPSKSDCWVEYLVVPSFIPGQR